MGTEKIKTAKAKPANATAIPVRAMIPLLPLNAGRIRLEWPIEQGGFGVTARTDTAGLPYIGLYRLDPQNYAEPRPIEFPRDRLSIGLIAGYDGDRVIQVFIAVEITVKGLRLRVNMPQFMYERGYPRYLFVPWQKT
jgi:hypothetical protein